MATNSHGGWSASNNDISPTTEAVEMEPSTGATFFHTEYKKHGDLREMLDSNKDSLKLDAMKRIISMLAKGRDVSDLFPAVVKNVASKNIEVKKLVYVYLTRYAEEQQDLALLSISTFQRALKDPNQLIRASALRVLSSIRVPVIVPIMLPAIKESAVDMSPFVRKTAAHAIPKLYSLEPEMKEELICVIEKLLADRTTLVVGSAAMAFEEVCPDRVELIHKNYRKLVNLLVDVEEWGQVTLVNMLTRYARTQFQDPNLGVDFAEEEEGEKAFYDNSDEDEEEEEDEEKLVFEQGKMKPLYRMDPDHRLLLRSTRPLLQSRNAAVVMATAQLYWHLAPRPETVVVAKALVRLLRSHHEVQAVVLNAIASMTIHHDAAGTRMFGPFIRQFFVRASDPAHVKILKLEILTNLARGDNISVLLREFQSYISGGEKSSVAATIQAIGRCAASIPDVTTTCLSGLVHLLSSSDQAVVAESVLEIKKLLQTQEGEEHTDIISQMARLVDTIEVASARAAILWVVGEYCDRIPLIAPDVLRKMAKTFCSEQDEVKLQILNLSVKLCLTNPKQTKLLTQYVLNLAKYDMNYDIRDRARFIRAFLFPAGESAKIQKLAKKVFLAEKPAPTIQSKFQNREEYQLGSLSHYINAKASGYQDLPEFPEVPPDASVRNVEPPKPTVNPWQEKEDSPKKSGKAKGGSRTVGGAAKFYDDDSNDEKKKGKKKKRVKNGGGGDVSGSSTADSDSSSSSSSSSGSGSGSSSSSASSSDEEEQVVVKKKAVPAVKSKQQLKVTTPAKPQIIKGSIATEKRKTALAKSESESDSDSSSSEDDQPVVRKGNTKGSAAAPAPVPKSNLDLLLDLDNAGDNLAVGIVPMAAMPAPQLLGGITPLTAATDSAAAVSTDAKPMWVASTATELLNRMATGGVQVDYRFTRHPHIYAPDMLAVEVTFTNTGTEEAGEIKVGAKRLASGMAIHEFPGLANISPAQRLSTTLGIDFRDTTQPAQFDLVIGGRPHGVSLAPPMGEMVRPVRMSEVEFDKEQGKLRGMCEMRGRVELPSHACDTQAVIARVYTAANLLQVPAPTSEEVRFAGRTLSARHPVLASLRLTPGGEEQLTVKTENIVIGSMLLKEITAALQK